MAVDREAVYAALAARLQTKIGASLSSPVSRRARDFASINTADQPACYVVATDQTPVVAGPKPPHWILGAVIVLLAYGDDADDTKSVETTLNGLIRSVEAALERQPDEQAILPGQQVNHWTTLGGKVIKIIPGQVTMSSGDDGLQGLAAMPVDLFLPP